MYSQRGFSSFFCRQLPWGWGEGVKLIAYNIFVHWFEEHMALVCQNKNKQKQVIIKERRLFACHFYYTILTSFALLIIKQEKNRFQYTHSIVPRRVFTELLMCTIWHLGCSYLYTSRVHPSFTTRTHIS